MQKSITETTENVNTFNAYSCSYITFPDTPEPFIFLPPPRATVPDARLRRLARHLHQLGERSVYEILREIIGGRDPVLRLEVYAECDPDFFEAIGADKLPDTLRGLS
jgi:hypothetical protein